MPSRASTARLLPSNARCSSLVKNTSTVSDTVPFLLILRACKTTALSYKRFLWSSPLPFHSIFLRPPFRCTNPLVHPKYLSDEPSIQAKSI
ncbi:hypothetical protein VTO42DRAFT_5356 [Malbranchea cinnamomea]